MNNHLRLSIIILFFMASFRLYSSECHCQNETQKQIVTVVFCDLTKSIDSLSIRAAARNARKLIQCLPAGTVFKFFCIGRASDSGPILEFDKPLQAKTASEMRKNQRTVSEAAEVIHNGILKLYSKLNSMSEERIVPSSCIIQTLEIAQGIFQGYKRTLNNNCICELIYLSDMIEECNNKPVGPIMTQNKFESTKTNIEQYKPQFNLGYANVSIIISPGDESGNPIKISLTDRWEIWKKIFMRVGFTEKQVDAFDFTTTFPPRLAKYSKPD